MFTFKILKSNDTTEEKYQSALHCARVSVESVLSNEELIIKVFEDTITIAHVNPELSISMTALTCKEQIKGCFCDRSGKLFPEFMKIVPPQR